MKFRVIKGRQLGKMFDIAGAPSLGSEPDNQIVIEDDGVSRHHAKLTLTEHGICLIEDLDSTNGVRVNSEKIDIRHPIRPGDRIGIGNTILLVTDDKGNVPASLLTEHGAGAGGRQPIFAAVAILLLAALAGVVMLLLWGTGREEDQAVADDQNAIIETDEPVAVQPSAWDILDPAPPEPAETEEDEDADERAPAPEAEPAVPDEARPAEAEERPREEARHSVVVRSRPPGAVVTINGEAVGETPVAVHNLTAGRHRIELEKTGYERLSRLFFLPLREPLPEYQMELAPKTLRITSEPVGATVFRGPQMLGHTPLLIDHLPEGEHRLRLLAYGYEQLVVAAEVNPLRGELLEATMKPATAELIVMTIPADCAVYVDDVYMGTTVRPEQEPINRSQPFQVGNLIPGSRRVEVRHANSPESHRQTVSLGRGETSQIPVRLWVLERKITFTDGRVMHGMLISQNEQGDLVLATAPDQRTTIARETIQENVRLSPEEALKILRPEPEPEPAAEGGESPDPFDDDFWQIRPL